MDQLHIRMIPTQTTLIKYENPTIDENRKLKAEHEDEPILEKREIDDEIREMLKLQMNPGCPDLSQFEGISLVDVLNTSVQPIEWIQKGKMWKQQVFEHEVSRDYVLKITEAFNTQLKTRQAKPTGFCSVRRQLYSQLFDELIRQIETIYQEYGPLIGRIRDELEMTMRSFDSIYESCKYFQSSNVKSSTETMKEEQDRKDKENNDPRLLSLNQDIDRLEKKVKLLQDGYELRELFYQEIFDANERLFEEDKAHQQKIQLMLQKQLELFNGPNPHAEATTGSILDQFIKQSDHAENPDNPL